MLAPRILHLLAFLGLSFGQQIADVRKLALEEIAGYSPSTTVTDYVRTMIAMDICSYSSIIALTFA